MSPCDKRGQYLSYPWGSLVSRRSSRHYGNYRGIWDTRGSPISRTQRFHAPGQHLCHKHQACSSSRHHHGSPYQLGSSTSRLNRSRSSHPHSKGSTGHQLALYRLRMWREARQLCGRKLSSSMSEIHQCDGSLGGSGEWVRHSSTPRCE